MKKPIIAIVGRPIVSESGRQMVATYLEVCEVITAFGGIPLQISLSNINTLTKEDQEDIIRIIQLCNGILLQGGSDFYDYDIFVAQKAHELDLPTLGICLGMQTMACAFHGELGRIKHHQSLKKYVHPIDINPQSQLFKILPKQQLMVNSRHQEVVLNTDLYVCARAEDGSIEAVEDTNKRFYLGVQWHPESMISYNSDARKLIETFIACCRH